jgi:uncharacterized protein YeaO (DUF488 family)
MVRLLGGRPAGRTRVKRELAMKIRVNRIYDAPSRADGYRVLVDRLWPRGIRKADAALDEWAKGMAPSDGLRKWFGHDPNRWDAFVRRYMEELESHKDDVAAMVARSPKETITLLYAAKDTERNNAVVLKRFIETAHTA